MTNRRFISAIVLISLLSVSCERGPAPPPAPPPAPAKGPAAYVTQGVTGWGWGTKHQGGIPGLDFAKIHYGTWDDGVVFAVWNDFDRASGEDHFNETSEAPEKKYAGGMNDPSSERKVVFECKTADGKTGSITVNGQSFDLSQGWLILASTARDELKQLKPERVSAKTPPGPSPESFENLKADPDVKAFFNMPAEPDKPK